METVSAEAMTAPIGEVRLDGRIDYPDGTWSGLHAAGQVVRGTTGTHSVDGWPIAHSMPVVADLRVPTTWQPAPVVADIYWYETFMERLMRDVERRPAKAS